MENINQAADSVSSLRAIIDSLEDELMVIDRNYRIIEVNRTFTLHHGEKREEVIGKYCYDIVPGLAGLCQSPRSKYPLQLVREPEQAVQATHTPAYYSDGEHQEKHLDIVASPDTKEHGKVIVVAESMRDEPEGNSQESRIAEDNEYLLTLNNIATLVSQSLSLDIVLYTALDKTLETMNKCIGGILLLDEEKQELRYAAYRGLSARYVKEMHFRLGEGIAGKVAQIGEALVSEDILADPRAVFPNLIMSEGLRAFASVPLISKNKVQGVLNVACLEPCQFSGRDIQLLNSIAAQVAIAIENAKLHQKVQLQDTTRGELLQEIFSIQEEERKRIARELHDETSQVVVSLSTILKAISTMLPDDICGAVTKLKIAQAQTSNILDGLHRLIYELRPSLLDDLGLVSALRWLVEHNSENDSINIRFKKTGRTKRLSSQIETTIFRVVQEAVSNIVKHAQCKRARINIDFKPDTVKVYIEDDGKGFDVQEAIHSSVRPKGLGLIGMKERVELIKGSLNISSSPGGKGTVIIIEIPIESRGKC